MAKICELKVNANTDRNNVITSLVNAGYRVSVDNREINSTSYKSDYFVIVEDGSENNAND